MSQDIPPDAVDMAHAAALQPFYSRPGLVVRRAHQVIIASFIDAMGAVRLTPTQFAALVVICEQPAIDQITLARRLGIDRTNASMVVNGLTQNGWVHCTRAPNDARRNLLTATRAGEGSMVLARDIAIAHGRMLESLMPEGDFARLTGLVRKLLSGLPSSAPEWQRPDGTADFLDLSPLAQDYPAHAALYGAVGFLIRRAQQVLEAVFLEGNPHKHMTPRRSGLLFVTAQIGPTEQQSLARWLALDHSTMASVVADMVKKGLIARHMHPTDKRRRLLEITDLGRAVMADTSKAAQAAADRVLAPLGDEGETFLRLMQQFLLATQHLNRVAIHPAVVAQNRALYGMKKGG